MAYIMAHWADIMEAAAMIVAGAAIISNLTPTDSDNKAVAAVSRLLDFLGANWGNRNPRKNNAPTNRMRCHPAAVIGALVLAAALAGCTSTPQAGVTKRVITACSAISGSVNVLAVNKTRLDAGEIAIVDHVIATAEPICTAPTPPEDALAVLSALSSQLMVLQASLVAEGVNG